MEPSSDRHEDGAVGFGLATDSMVSGGRKGILMESDGRISSVHDNEVNDCRSDMRLINGEIAGFEFVNDAKFGANLGISGVHMNVSKVHEMRAIDLVVDLRRFSTNQTDSDQNKVNSNGDEFCEKEGEYEFSDLVWGKVKNHPWWPGQIINPSASTNEAMKHFKKDGFLIAYFGAQKFAFNELYTIKPFRMNFCKFGNQSKAEAFNRAVNHALHEAVRRVEFGLTCSCVSKEIYSNIRSQTIVNSGIRTESNRIDGGDRFSTVNSFNPTKTVDFLQDFAKDPLGVNRLDGATIGGQLSAFNRWKGFHQLQINQVLNESHYEFDDIDPVPDQKGKPNACSRPHERKHLFNCGSIPVKKVRFLTDLMSNGRESESDAEYRPKKRGRKRKAIGSKRSVEGSQSQSKSKSQTAEEFLSQIHQAAINRIEGQLNLVSLVNFFSDFNNYRLREYNKDEEMTIATESDIYLKPNEENSPASLTFKLTSLDSVPSVKKLHRIFSRYGALHEAETRVLKKKKCVKLVFERKRDAETAFSSPGKYSIFGPALVCYQLNLSPTLRKAYAASKRG